ncbi:MAG: nitrate reductase molybdenum cofactor assembly chaperone [Caulobacterales bacterium]|nr:nitrate reductase molybdenum cofactor assembly chaperone [Caulobacterales bacterium]
MALIYRALGLMLSYPDEEQRRTVPAILDAVAAEPRIPAKVARAVARLGERLMLADLYELQEDYVQVFDRTRSQSLNLYEHVHGESRDRGQAMANLVELYNQQGLELAANELPDFLPVFLDFLSVLPDERAASLLGEAVHVLEALALRLHKRGSPYRAVFGALVALSDEAPDSDAVAALMEEAEENPDDLTALDQAWEETAVTFGPATDEGCPKAEAMLKAMGTPPGGPPAQTRSPGGPL